MHRGHGQLERFAAVRRHLRQGWYPAAPADQGVAVGQALRIAHAVAIRVWGIAIFPDQLGRQVFLVQHVLQDTRVFRIQPIAIVEQGKCPVGLHADVVLM